jgi:hypothetical protein
MRSFEEPEDLKELLMRNDLDPLILDLLEWIGRQPRSYADVIDAWRTSCPRLTVWEDAMDRGFATREHAKGHEVMIRLTDAGRGFLREQGRIVGDAASRRRTVIASEAKQSRKQQSKDWIASSLRSSQ